MQGLRIYLESDEELRKYIKDIIQTVFNSLEEKELRDKFDKEYYPKLIKKLDEAIVTRINEKMSDRWSFGSRLDKMVTEALDRRINKIISKYTVKGELTLIKDENIGDTDN